MVPGTWTLLISVIALLGTGGAVGSWLVLWRTRRREDRTRWHQDRRAAYERFLVALEHWRNEELYLAQLVAELRNASGWDTDPVFDTEDFLQAADNLSDDWARHSVGRARSRLLRAREARAEVNAAIVAMRLVSADFVVRAAVEVRDRVSKLVQIAEDYPPRECGGWSDPLVEADEVADRARDEFVKATRRELGVPD